MRPKKKGSPEPTFGVKQIKLEKGRKENFAGTKHSYNSLQRKAVLQDKESCDTQNPGSLSQNMSQRCETPPLGSHIDDRSKPFKVDLIPHNGTYPQILVQ